MVPAHEPSSHNSELMGDRADHNSKELGGKVSMRSRLRSPCICGACQRLPKAEDPFLAEKLFHILCSNRKPNSHPRIWRTPTCRPNTEWEIQPPFAYFYPAHSNLLCGWEAGLPLSQSPKKEVKPKQENQQTKTPWGLLHWKAAAGVPCQRP